MSDGEKKEAQGKGDGTGHTHPKGGSSAPMKESAHALFGSLHETLRGYEAHHMAKVPPVPEPGEAGKAMHEAALAKAKRNGQLATRIERWLEANPKLHETHRDNIAKCVAAAYEAGAGKAPEPGNENVAVVQGMVEAMLAPVLAIYDPDTEQVDTYDATMARLAIRVAMPLLQNLHGTYMGVAVPGDGESVQ